MNIEVIGKRIQTMMKISALSLFAFLLTTSMISAQDAAAAPTAAGLYNQGLAKLKAKDYAGGLPLLEQALTQAEADGNEKVVKLSKTNGAMAAYNLGMSKRKTKAYDEANALFNKGIGLSETYSSNYIGLARVLDEQGKKTEALEAYFVGAEKAEAEGKAKKAADAKKRAKGMVTKLYSGKKYAEVVSLGEALLAKMDNADVSYYVGKSMVQTGNDAGAVAHYDKAIAGGIKDTDKVNYAKATTLEKLGKTADALAAYKLVTGEKYKAQVDHKLSTLK